MSIQGFISFESSLHAGSNFIALNTINLDILYFLEGKEILDTEFASLWRVLEWENKIHIKTCFSDFLSVISELENIANFKCLTQSNKNKKDECEVFSANLFCLSKFGISHFFYLNFI